jgi:hypothetical protein
MEEDYEVALSKDSKISNDLHHGNLAILVECVVAHLLSIPGDLSLVRR